MAVLHHVRFRVHVHATEDPERVHQALAFLTGDAPIEETDILEGHHANPIRVLESTISSSPEVQAFLRRLTEDPAVLTALAQDLERRVDDACNLYLRLDKQQAVLGHVVLAADGDVIHARAKVAAYPARREVALARLREALGSSPEAER